MQYDVILSPLVLLQAAQPPTAPAPSGPAAPAGEANIDFIDVMINAPAEVKALVVILVVMFVLSLFIMGAKGWRMFSATRQSKRFLDMFWAQEQGGTWAPERLESVYAQIKRVEGSPIAKVFHAGYVELARLT